MGTPLSFQMRAYKEAAYPKNDIYMCHKILTKNLFSDTIFQLSLLFNFFQNTSIDFKFLRRF